VKARVRVRARVRAMVRARVRARGSTHLVVLVGVQRG